jgi:DNA polymerase III epsilon subunit family exonuclease
LLTSLLDAITYPDKEGHVSHATLHVARKKRESCVTLRDVLLPNLTFVVMDLETTGFGHDARIVEVAGVRFEEWQPTDQFHSIIQPECHIPGSASRVHGISNEMVKDAPLFKDLAPSLAHFMQDAVVIGHNFFSFDLRFLTKELRDVFGAGPDHWVIDTLPLARQCLPGKKHKLEQLAPLLGIPLENAHEAMSDVYATSEVWLHLYQQLTRRGVKTLEDIGRFKAIRKLDGSGLPRFDTAPPRPCLGR